MRRLRAEKETKDKQTASHVKMKAIREPFQILLNEYSMGGTWPEK